MFEIHINLSGFDTLAASISDLAEALSAGVKADQIIGAAKQSSRKPRTPAPVVEEEAKPGIPVVEQNQPLTDVDQSISPDAGIPISPPSEPSAAQITALSAAQAETVAPAAPVAEAAPTILEVRAAIAALAKTDKARAIGILAKHGAASVSSLKEEFFAAALAEATR